jgi:hypothetical protein
MYDHTPLRTTEKSMQHLQYACGFMAAVTADLPTLRGGGTHASIDAARMHTMHGALARKPAPYGQGQFKLYDARMHSAIALKM